MISTPSVELLRDLDLRSLPDEFYIDPFPIYAALRSHAPVKRMPDDTWLVSRYQEVEFVYKNPKLFSSDKKFEFGRKFGDSPLFAHHTTSLVFNDPPYHTRVRRLLNGALTPRAVQRLQPALEASVARLLEELARSRSVDLIAQFAAAIPIEVIGDLLRVPYVEREPLRGWSLAILGALEPQLTPKAQRLGNRAVEEFSAYLSVLIDRRRREQGDADDLLWRLLQPDADGGRLGADELIHNCIFLLNAGHETTTNLIANALVSLARYPRERERLLAAPQLLKSAVEEFLRFESPNQLGNRITTQPLSLAGIQLAAGTPITLCIGAANRDPAQFPQPDDLDIARSPNRHLAFGSGTHQCIGMSVARLEASVAILAFLVRFPRYSLLGEPQRQRRARFRGFVRVDCLLA